MIAAARLPPESRNAGSRYAGKQGMQVVPASPPDQKQTRVRASSSSQSIEEKNIAAGRDSMISSGRQAGFHSRGFCTPAGTGLLRRCRLFVCLVPFWLSLWLSAAAQAQEPAPVPTSPPLVPASVPDIAPPSTPAVVSERPPWFRGWVRSLSRSIETVETVFQPTAQAPAGRLLAGMQALGQFPGLDGTRPWQVFVFAEGDSLRHPAVIVLIPVSDAGAFMRACQAWKPEQIQEISSGTWTVRLGGQELQAVARERELFLTNSTSLLERSQSLVPILAEYQSTHDFFVELRSDGIPEAARLAWWDWGEKALARKKEHIRTTTDLLMPVHSALLDALEQIRQMLAEEPLRLTGGVTFSTGAVIELKLVAASGSALASQLNALALPAVDCWSLVQTAAGELDLALRVPAFLQPVFDSAFGVVETQMTLAVGPHLKKADQGPAAGAFDSIEKTIRKGELVASAVFLETTARQLIFSAAIQVADPQRIGESLRTVLPYAAKSEEIREVQLDQIDRDGLHVHRIQNREIRPSDARIYGNDASLYVGLAPETFLFAVGGEEVTPLLESGRSQRLEAPPLMHFRWHARPWLECALPSGASESGSGWQAAFPLEKPQDELAAQVLAARETLTLTVHLQAGYFAWLRQRREFTPATPEATDNALRD